MFYLILVAAALGVGIGNLIALWRYVKDTAAISKTAQDQLEAAWTPCVLPHLPVERLPTGAEVDPIRSAPVHLLNAGHGPALNVLCLLQTTNGSQSLGSLAAPFLAAGTSTANLEMENLPDRRAFNWAVFHLRATYKSVSGKKYETVVTIAPGEAAAQYHLIYFGPEREDIPLVERYRSL